MKRIALIAALCAAAAAAPAAAQSPYDNPNVTWELTQIDTTFYKSKATLNFPEPGQVAGKAPCNNFTGMQKGTWPDFETGPLAVTRMACPEMAEENEFFRMLALMTSATTADETLTLSGDGHLMIFIAAE